MKNTLTHVIACIVLGLSSAMPSYSQNPEKFLVDSMPKEWPFTLTHYQTVPTNDKWWDNFNDPMLTGLIEKAVSNNFDVRAAMDRIEMARQVWRQTRSGYYPQLQLSAGWNKSQESGLTSKHATDVQRMDYFNIGVSMNWEIDVFGKIRAASKADKAAYEASEAEYDAVMVSLCGNLAKAYVDLRVAQREYEITKADVAAQETLTDLANTRYECGLVPELDVVQGRASIQNTQSSLPPIQARIASDINTIALLCGVYPAEVSDLIYPAPIPEVPPTGAVGIPADLLRRRPDVVQAEKELAQYAALAGVAQKEWLPSLTLNGSIGTSAHEFTDLFSKNSFNWEVAPSLTWTIFDGMSREAGIAKAKAQLQAGIEQYNLTVMTAVQEADNAIIELESAQQQSMLMLATAKSYNKILQMQTDRYRQGLCDFQDLIDAQINCLDSSNSIAESRGNELTALITLYVALGGGF